MVVEVLAGTAVVPVTDEKPLLAMSEVPAIVIPLKRPDSERDAAFVVPSEVVPVTVRDVPAI
jgi:hypothetical protein